MKTKILQKKVLCSGSHRDFVQANFLDAKGQEKTYEYVHGHGGAVFVLPFTRDGKIILIKNYRIPLEKIVNEIPAGGIEPGEDPMAAAEREMLEETGYKAEQMVKIGFTPANPGMVDTYYHYFVALNCEFMPTQQKDEQEDIVSVFEYNVEEIAEKFSRGDGKELWDSRIFAALEMARMSGLFPL